MYPHPELNSYLHGLQPHVSKNIINRMIDKARNETTTSSIFKSELLRLASTQPQCYGPLVDVTRAKCGFGSFALPKLRRELHSDDPLIVRQAVTTLGDLVFNPEKLIEAVELNIPDRLTDLLTSNDPYLRERVAMIYMTIANQAAGRKAISKNLTTIANLSKGLDDNLAAVRLKIAQALETLACDYCTADLLCMCGFVEFITAKLYDEKKHILIVYLDVLILLLHRNIKAKAIEGGTFDELLKLLDRKDEKVLCKVLSCLRVLCEDLTGKNKAIETNLLKILKSFLQDERESFNVEAAQVASFITVTTAGKLRVLELGMLSTLLCLAAKCRCSCELLLPIMKTLTNVAEAPEGRRRLLEKHITFIEDIDAGDIEILQRQKETLLAVIRWKP